MKKFYPLKIWLKGRQKPIEILASTDCIAGFTDFANDNYPLNLFNMQYIDSNNKNRWLVIQQNQIQAFEFDDLQED
ncbi:hypothetical protein [Paenibacillus sp. MSJ-34]|uniref:hypothetical protein n=1 Tax=Paenibacillus sp. MSJ-34 TaxID=2841529 RepID=UPI001C112A56|nr:hypothetical protein [Paenibacillus sp. MSJ-34]MBU5445676.1 hypothetical protein [Paenibacillus sp. MSJ-34]